MAAAMSVIYEFTFGQLGGVLTGIPEGKYFFSIGHATIISLFFF
jgi:hypothetical protein